MTEEIQNTGATLGGSSVTHVDVADPRQFVQELQNTRKSARALIGLMRQGPQTEDNQSIVEALEAFVEAKIPSPRQMARAAMAGLLTNDGIFLLWTRARKAILAASPSILDLFLAKMENERLPHSERLLVEAMRGTGLLTPGVPETGEDREKAIDKSEIRKLTDAELRQRLTDGLQETGDGE